VVAGDALGAFEGADSELVGVGVLAWWSRIDVLIVGAPGAGGRVAEVVQYISDEVKIRAVEADAMYAGIVIDTHNFQNQTGVRTFEAAAFLRRKGADVIRVRKLFRDKIENYFYFCDLIQKNTALSFPKCGHF